jgi:hypothetical protein
MKLGQRALLRTGAATIGLVAVAAFAAPAVAADGTDLEVRLDGGTIAEGAERRMATVSVINNGPYGATAVTIAYDFSGLIKEKVTVDMSFYDMCDVDGDHVVCGVTETGTLDNGADIDLDLPLVKVAGATGDAGSVSATVAAEGVDPTPANNKSTLPVKIEGEGVDLNVWAPDVYQWDAEAKFFSTTPVLPGGTSRVFAVVWNRGDKVADGIGVALQLPEHTTLTTPEDECQFGPDNRTAVCAYPEAVIQPEVHDLDGSFGAFAWEIKVSEDAPGPVALTGGEIVFTALAEKDVEPTEDARTATPEQPEGMPDDFRDVDWSDNIDEYSVFVGENGGAGGGGPLPVTGPAAAGIAVGGAAVLALGLVLFFAARRRRIVTQA